MFGLRTFGIVSVLVSAIILMGLIMRWAPVDWREDLGLKTPIDTSVHHELND